MTDPNGTFAGASPLLLDRALTAVFVSWMDIDVIPGLTGSAANVVNVGPTDVDMLRLDVTVGGFVTIELGSQPIFIGSGPFAISGEDFNSYLRLFDGNGQQIATDDDSGFGQYSKLEVYLNPGSYYVGISGFNNTQYNPNVQDSGRSGETGTYSVQINFGNPDAFGATRISGVGDINSDGFDDIILSNIYTGTNRAWSIGNNQVSGFNPLPFTDPLTGWSIAASGGDFDGNSSDEILLQNSSGEIGAWNMSTGNIVGFTPLPYIPPSAGWKIVGGGSFTGGPRDILLQNSSGATGFWSWDTLNDQIGSFTPLPFIDPNSGWRVVGAGRLTSSIPSAPDDIILSNANGATGFWSMSSALNGAVTGFNPLPYIDPASGWKIAGVGDFNGNGYDDVLLNNTSGANAIWSFVQGDIGAFVPLPTLGA
jgi:hypothetical protein